MHGLRVKYGCMIASTPHDMLNQLETFRLLSLILWIQMTLFFVRWKYLLHLPISMEHIPSMYTKNSGASTPAPLRQTPLRTNLSTLDGCPGTSTTAPALVLIGLSSSGEICLPLLLPTSESPANRLLPVKNPGASSIALHHMSPPLAIVSFPDTNGVFASLRCLLYLIFVTYPSQDCLCN